MNNNEYNNQYYNNQNNNGDYYNNNNGEYYNNNNMNYNNNNGYYNNNIPEYYNNNNNQSPKKGFNFGVFFCIIIIIGLCGYIAYDKGVFDSFKKTENNTVNKNESSNENENKEEEKEETPKADLNLSFDLSKCSTCDTNYNYHLSSNNGNLASAKLDDTDHKKVIVTINYDPIVSFIGDEVKEKGSKEYNLSFTKNVTDIVYSDYGLDTTYGTLLYLFEDSTVEYTPIIDAAVKGEIKSYGQVSGLTNIVKFYTGVSASSKGEVGSFYTTLAQSSDGTLYDVMRPLSTNGNYSYSG